jgi:hypothetical protein
MKGRATSCTRPKRIARRGTTTRLPPIVCWGPGLLPRRGWWEICHRRRCDDATTTSLILHAHHRCSMQCPHGQGIVKGWPTFRWNEHTGNEVSHTHEATTHPPLGPTLGQHTVDPANGAAEPVQYTPESRHSPLQHLGRYSVSLSPRLNQSSHGNLSEQFSWCC